MERVPTGVGVHTVSRRGQAAEIRQGFRSASCVIVRTCLDFLF